jgi:hypothetical protein
VCYTATRTHSLTRHSVGRHTGPAARHLPSSGPTRAAAALQCSEATAAGVSSSGRVYWRKREVCVVCGVRSAGGHGGVPHVLVLGVVLGVLGVCEWGGE